MKIWEHFKTITAHRHKVIEHCAKAGIFWQGLGHDLSKYSPAEFFVSAAHYLGDKSPTEAERAEYGYSKAWLHHKGRNKHHFEYWADYSPITHRVEPIKMPRKYVAEMFCDRLAAGKIYSGARYRDDQPLEYFLRGKDRRVIHPETSEEIEHLLRMLADEGEDKTFGYIRTWLKNEK